MISEQNIVAGIKMGNEETFRQLYDLYNSKIYSVSRRFGLDHDDAKEIVQEVFLRIWQKKDTLESDTNLNAYLLTITKNLIINRARKQTYEAAYKNYLEKNDGLHWNPTEDTIVYNDLKIITDKLINNLPPQQKEIFLMAKKDELSQKEIAIRLGVSLRTVENQIYRATKSIKEQLKNYEIMTVPMFLLLQICLS